MPPAPTGSAGTGRRALIFAAAGAVMLVIGVVGAVVLPGMLNRPAAASRVEMTPAVSGAATAPAAASSTPSLSASTSPSAAAPTSAAPQLPPQVMQPPAPVTATVVSTTSVISTAPGEVVVEQAPPVTVTATPHQHPDGSSVPAPDPQAAVLPVGWGIVPGGTGGDALCNSIYLQDHPGDTAAQGSNPERVGWLPGQTQMFTGDPSVYYPRRVVAPMAAWNWTCGRPGVGFYVTWPQLSWYCEVVHPFVPSVRAYVRDQNNAYTWECIAPS
jgi:hypothetical protein